MIMTELSVFVSYIVYQSVQFVRWDVSLSGSLCMTLF